MRLFLTFLCMIGAVVSTAQQASIPVADQTFRADGLHKFAYALAEGDELSLSIQLISGRNIKSVELIQWPATSMFRAYQLDTLLQKKLWVPATGVYILQIEEQGIGKKICRFTLHRTPKNADTRRMDTRVAWDLAQFPEFQIRQKQMLSGKRTELVSTAGTCTVPGSKMGTQKPKSAWQFALPPYTTQWAYRVGVGQSVQEARRADAEKFKALTQQGAVKMMAYQPETALAAFALGMAVDMTTSTAGEDVEYAIMESSNAQKFFDNQPYDAYIWQSGISVDVQRRYSPLTGTYTFAFKNNNWIDDIEVTIDIEIVTEVPVYEVETYLEPFRRP